MILKQYVLSKMPKGKLQSMCREHNLPISGTRSSIITRLVSSTDWSQLQSKQPNEELAWYEKIFCLALLDGAKTKSAIFETEAFKKILDHVPDEKLKADLAESVFRWSKKGLVRGKLVIYNEKSRQYLLNQEIIEDISLLVSTNSDQIVSEFKQSRYVGFYLIADDNLRKYLKTDLPAVKYSTRLPVRINFESGNEFIRILAFSDWRVQDIKDVFVMAERTRPDFILYGGDDLERFRQFGLNQFTELSKLSKTKKVLAVLGNDDFYAQAKEVLKSEGIHDLYNESAIYGNFAFIGLESSTSGPAIFRHEEQDFESHLTCQYEHLQGKKLIILSHTPPFGLLDRGIRFASEDEGSHHIGSSALRRFLESHKVDLVICGHCHSHGGLAERIGNTTVVNVSSHDDYRAVGKFAIIDLFEDGHVDVDWHDTRELVGEHSTQSIWGVGPVYSKKLSNSGVTTVQELSSYPDLENLSMVSGISSSLLAMFQLRAKSKLENSIFQIYPFEAPDGNLIFIDIETDIASERVWLIGLLVDDQFIQLYADNWGEEKNILTKFLRILKDHPDHNLVSYSCINFDYNVLLNALNRHGLDASVLESHEHMDLGIKLRSCFVFPNQSYALKNLGAFMNYPFKHPEIDGFLVALQYMSHVEDKKPLDKTLLEYNEDDVRAIPYLISEIKSKGAKKACFLPSASKDAFSSITTQDFICPKCRHFHSSNYLKKKLPRKCFRCGHIFS